MEHLQGTDGGTLLIIAAIIGCAYLIARLGQWYARRDKSEWIDIDPKVYRH